MEGLKMNNVKKWFDAIKNNDLSTIASTLESKEIDVNVQDDEKRTGLIIACNNMNVDIVKILLKYDADIFKTNKFNQTPFICACGAGSVEIMKTLLEKGANINDCDDKNSSAFMYSCFSNREKAISFFLERNDVDFKKCNDYGETGFMSICKQGSLNIVKLFDEKQLADVYFQNDEGQTPFISSCVYGQYDIALFLAEKGANIHVVDRVKQNAFMKACKNKNLEIALWLLDKGIDFSRKDFSGYTGLALFFTSLESGLSQTNVSDKEKHFIERTIEKIGVENLNSYLQHDQVLNFILRKNEDLLKIWEQCEKNCAERQRIKNTVGQKIDSFDDNVNSSCFER